MKTNWLESDDNYLIYFGDTMCSWCYGFAPELSTIKENNPTFQFKIVNGGLRPNNQEKSIGMADFLRDHWIEIEKRTGQPFNFEILEDPDYIYDTEPASRAVVVARFMNPTVEWDFFKAVQDAFYRDNLNLNQLETFLEIAKNYNLDLEEFKNLFESDDMKHLTKTDFQLSAEMGIKGFPSMVLKKGKEFFLISNGYREAKDVQEIIDRIMAK